MFIFFKDNNGNLRKLDAGDNVAATLEFLSDENVKSEINQEKGVTPHSAVLARVK